MGREENKVLPKLYEELAEWWPLLSAPDEYEEEAAVYSRFLGEVGEGEARTVLELGSGGGNNAFYLKRSFEMTLVDLSAGMQEHSRRLNPECEHHLGDMRSIRLGRQFDRVFIQDAICYMASTDDLRQAIETAYVHCRPGGGVVVAPDHVRETFAEATEHGGRDGSERSLRYLEWVWDPDPTDNHCIADYVYVLREADGSVRTEHDRHIEGVFSRGEWLEILRQVGFEGRIATFQHSELPAPLDVILGTRPGRAGG